MYKDITPDTLIPPPMADDDEPTITSARGLSRVIRIGDLEMSYHPYGLDMVRVSLPGGHVHLNTEDLTRLRAYIEALPV